MSSRGIYGWIETTSEWERSWGYEIIVKNTLNKLITTNYTNKIHFYFQYLNHRNSKVKCVWLIVWINPISMGTKNVERTHINF